MTNSNGDLRFDQSIDQTKIQDRARTTFDKTVADIETKIGRTKQNVQVLDADEDDIFPGAAKEMGSGRLINEKKVRRSKLVFFSISEAKIRFLKAQLRVMKEEVERMHGECVKRVIFLSCR